MTIKKILKITDVWGNIQKGKIITVYPAGTTSNGTVATDNNDGTYLVEFDPFANPNVISESYDIWYDGSKQRSGVLFGDWIWRFKASLDSRSKTLAYADLLDSEGEAILPSILPHATCVGLVTTKDYSISCTSISDTQISLKIGSFGSGGLPVSVIITIFAGVEIKEAV